MTAPVALRDFRAGDAAAVHAWFCDPDATATLLEQRESFSEDDAREWVARAMDHGGEDRKWVVTFEGSDAPVGFTALYGLGRQTAPELGVLIGDADARGRGAGREAIRQTAERAFRAGAHRVYARILSRNEASQRAFEAVGFRREGVMRGHVRRAEALLDCELWGLLPQDLQAPAGGEEG